MPGRVKPDACPGEAGGARFVPPDIRKDRHAWLDFSMRMLSPHIGGCHCGTCVVAGQVKAEIVRLWDVEDGT